jgi:hypothetical protein
VQTVFSHIVQKKLSQENENVATEALAFVLQSHKSAHNGMMKLLRGIDPQMPHLWFRTQQTEGGKQIGDSSRPDMRGCGGEGHIHVFVENKFWAGLTANQPVSYLRILAECTPPTILLVVGPEARKETLWRELGRRLADNKISAANDSFAGIFRVATTSAGPILALTSWKALLDALELEVADDKSARSDLLQLQALCAAADSEAFLPISSEVTSDQRTPALILQLSSIVQTSVDRAVAKEILNLKGTNPQASAERIGRYAYFGAERRAGPWLGIHFGLWKKHGGTPLWVVFAASDFGRAPEVQALLEPWAAQQRVFTTSQEDGSFVVALDIASGEDKDQVVAGIVVRLEEMAGRLAALEPRAKGNLSNG